MEKKLWWLLIITCLSTTPLLSQTPDEFITPKGKYFVGFKTHVIRYPSHLDGTDSIDLVLNLWYPTAKPSDKKISVLDFTYNHLSPTYAINDSIKNVHTSSLRRNIQHWHGEVNDETWDFLNNQTIHSTKDADYHTEKFPLILGRLRVFSTTFTNEYVASHGYVVCMLSPVEDFPQDNEVAYHIQLSNEMNFYAFIKKYLEKDLGITSSPSGLMGFSGSGLSQFMTPMVFENFSAVALLESGVYLNGIFEVLSRHPAYRPGKFEAALLFLYNKARFEKLTYGNQFDALKSKNKHLILVDSEEQHHWDFASEGTITSLYLHLRTPEVNSSQIRLFNIMNSRIESFFDHYLKQKRNPDYDRGDMVVIK